VFSNEELTAVFFRLLQAMQPKIFCDIGAYDAEAAMRARAILPDSVIFAFEGNPRVHQAFKQRAVEFGIAYENVVIGDHDGGVTFYAPRTLSQALVDGRVIATNVTEPVLTRKGSILLRNEHASYSEYRVAGGRLDSILPPGPQAVALWIDVEGAAHRVLAGAGKTLERACEVFVEVEGFPFWHESANFDRIVSTFTGAGLAPLARDRQFGEHQFNMLFARTSLLNACSALTQGLARN
jgi:FkbM family methyltransferase